MKNFDTILLIDDDEATNFLHKLIINESGICKNLIVIDSALDALDWLKNENNPTPNLIFLDINMPKMNGWEFLEEYITLPSIKRTNMVVVMLTTSLRPKDRKRADLIDEISNFMNKPLSKNKLNSFLNSLEII